MFSQKMVSTKNLCDRYVLARNRSVRKMYVIDKFSEKMVSVWHVIAKLINHKLSILLQMYYCVFWVVFFTFGMSRNFFRIESVGKYGRNPTGILIRAIIHEAPDLLLLCISPDFLVLLNTKFYAACWWVIELPKYSAPKMKVSFCHFLFESGKVNTPECYLHIQAWPPVTPVQFLHLLMMFSPLGEGDVEDQEYQQLLTEHQLLLLEEEELLAIGRLVNSKPISLRVDSHKRKTKLWLLPPVSVDALMEGYFENAFVSDVVFAIAVT